MTYEGRVIVRVGDTTMTVYEETELERWRRVNSESRKARVALSLTKGQRKTLKRAKGERNV